MNGTLVYSNTAISSTDNTVSIGSHTQGIYLLNLNESTDATVQLNGKFNLIIPHATNQTYAAYVHVPGDYTSIKVVTTSVNIAVFAVG